MSAKEIRMSGALVVRHRRTLEALLTRDRVAAALAGIAAEEREEFLHASTLSWVRIPTMESVFRALAEDAGRDAAELHVEVVKRSVADNVGGVWRLLLRFHGDDSLVARLPRVFSRAYDGGRVSMVTVGEGIGTFKVDEWPGMPEYARRGLAAGGEEVLRLAGRLDAHIKCVSPAGADPVMFHVTWRL